MINDIVACAQDVLTSEMKKITYNTYRFPLIAFRVDSSWFLDVFGAFHVVF